MVLYCIFRDIFRVWRYFCCCFIEDICWVVSWEESLVCYGLGGYYFVCIGDVFSYGRYEILNKLGYGWYFIVWFVCDNGWVLFF